MATNVSVPAAAATTSAAAGHDSARKSLPAAAAGTTAAGYKPSLGELGGFPLATLQLSSFDALLVNMEGLAYDGARYLYASPHASLAIAKVDTWANDGAGAVVGSLDFSSLVPHTTAPGFIGCFIGSDDALYVLPHDNSGAVYVYIVRVDLTVPFGTTSAVSYIDFTNGGTNGVAATLEGVGGFSDGTYGYLVGTDIAGGPPMVLRFGLGASFTAAGVVPLSLAGGLTLTSMAAVGWDGSDCWVLGFNQPTGGAPPRQSYFIKIDPTHFDAAHTTWGQVGTTSDKLGAVFLDQAGHVWSAPWFGFNGVQTPLYRFNKTTMAVDGSWAVPPVITGFAGATMDTVGGRYAYAISSLESLMLVIDTQDPLASQLVGLGGYTGFEFGVLIAAGRLWLSPFFGTVGATGTLVSLPARAPAGLAATASANAGAALAAALPATAAATAHAAPLAGFRETAAPLAAHATTTPGLLHAFSAFRIGVGAAANMQAGTFGSSLGPLRLAATATASPGALARRVGALLTPAIGVGVATALRAEPRVFPPATARMAPGAMVGAPGQPMRGASAAAEARAGVIAANPPAVIAVSARAVATPFGRSIHVPLSLAAAIAGVGGLAVQATPPRRTARFLSYLPRGFIPYVPPSNDDGALDFSRPGNPLFTTI